MKTFTGQLLFAFFPLLVFPQELQTLTWFSDPSTLIEDGGLYPSQVIPPWYNLSDVAGADWLWVTHGEFTGDVIFVKCFFLPEHLEARLDHVYLWALANNYFTITVNDAAIGNFWGFNTNRPAPNKLDLKGWLRFSSKAHPSANKMKIRVTSYGFDVGWLVYKLEAGFVSGARKLSLAGNLTLN